METGTGCSCTNLFRTMSPFRRLSSFVGRSPMLVASSQTGLLMSIGDVISQTLVEKKSFRNVDLIRTARFGLVGFVIVGPVLRWWYGVLERKVKFSTAGSTAVGRMAADQLLFAPIFIFNFIGLMGVLNGGSMKTIQRDLRQKYFDIVITNYKIWPAAQVFNFWVVPLQHRILFAQTLSVFWNSYLSYKTNK